MVPLVMVQPRGTPWLNFSWSGTRAEFAQNEHPLAAALIYDDENTKEESVALNPKGSGRAFILFFTIRGENRVFFPSKTKMTFGIPSRFEFALLFEMKDWGIYQSKRYLVEVQTWDSFRVSRIEPKSRLHFLHKPS